jgi:hypothetical protein
VAVLALVTTGCRAQGLAFQQDHRITIVSPRDRAHVTAPVVVRWKVKDPAAYPGRGAFGVVVDRAPQPPGKGLDHFVGNDPACPKPAACVTANYLAIRGVYLTTETSFRVDTLLPRIGVPKDQRNLHEVTVVLLDSQGRRVGESGVSVNVRVQP